MNDQMNNIIDTIKSNVKNPTIKNIKKEFESSLILISWSAIKEEYEKMNTKQKIEFIKTIKKVIDDGDKTESTTNSEVPMKKIVVNEVVEEISEVQQLIKEEVDELTVKQTELRKELSEIQKRLHDLVPNNGKKESKMDVCKKIFSDNPDLTRKEYIQMFMDDAMCTKAGSATYYATIKKGIKVEPVEVK